MKLNPDHLRSLLRYEPETGKLFWLERNGPVNWNARFAGKEAFTATTTSGYKSGGVFGRTYQAHRVIWALTHGKWPKEIDHINGDRSDNRLSNLRNTDRYGNMKNLRLRKGNKTGIIGISFFAGLWRAEIQADGKRVPLGNHKCLGKAIAARKSAEEKYGFHKNHGSNPRSKGIN